MKQADATPNGPAISHIYTKIAEHRANADFGSKAENWKEPVSPQVANFG